MIKIWYCFAMLLWAMGLIGGTGYCIYCDAYPLAAGCLMNAYLSFDKVKEMFKKMML